MQNITNLVNLYHDHLVIHLKTGDSVSSVSNSSTYNEKDVTQSLEFIHQLITQNKYPIRPGCAAIEKKIVLITGFHKIYYRKSFEYINKFRDFFKSHNYDVICRINMNLDEDFIIMCNARFFISSNSFLSKIIKNIVREKGNVIIVP